MNLSPRVRAILRYLGYVVLALVTFVFALHLTFPYDRVRDKALEGLTSKYDVTIAGVERSWVPGRFALKGVTLKSRPSVAGQTVTTMYFKRIEIDLAFAPLLSGKVQIGLDVATGIGHIRGSVTQAKQEVAYAFDLSKVPLTMIPGVSDAVGLPMGGNADGKVRLKLVRGDWSKANGSFELECKLGCTVGDGQAKIYPKGRRPGDEAWTKDGIAVPALRIGRFKLAIDIVKGTAKRRAFEMASPDGEADIDINIKLTRNISDSTVTGCLKYKCSKELYDREPKLRSQCDLGSPIIDDKGLHHVKLMGKLSNVRRIGAMCDGTSTDPASGGAGLDRPTFDPPPVEPVRIIDAGVPEIDAAAPPPVMEGPIPPQHDDVAPPPPPGGAEMPPPPPPPPIVEPAPGAANPGELSRPGGAVSPNNAAGPPQPYPANPQNQPPAQP